MAASGYSPLSSWGKIPERMQDALMHFMEMPRRPGRDLLAFAEDTLGIVGAEALAQAMTGDEHGSFLQEYWFFPDETLRRFLLPVWEGRAWSPSLVQRLCAVLWERKPVACMDLGDRRERLPLGKAVLYAFVQRLYLERRIEADLWKKMADLEPQDRASSCRIRLWELGGDVVGERAKALVHLLACCADMPSFDAWFGLMLEVLREAGPEEVWPGPLLRFRRRQERCFLAARRVEAALRNGAMETLMLSGERVLHGDSEGGARRLHLVDGLLHRAWPGVLPRDEEMMVREFARQTGEAS